MEQEEAGQPSARRLVGIDLGIASRHSVRVLEADGRLVSRSSCVPTVESLARLEQTALAGAPEGTRLAVVFEPTGPAWLPIAVFFGRRGHDVYRVSSAKAADLRRFLRRHAKSSGIDAETLARIPLADPGGLQRLDLPGPDAAALDRRVRACARLTQAAAEHKTRVKDLVRQLMPVTPLTGDIGQADLAVLERSGGPAGPAGRRPGRAHPADHCGLPPPARTRPGTAMACCRGRRRRTLRRAPCGAVHRTGRRGDHRDPAAARHRRRAGRPRHRPRAALPARRPPTSSPAPCPALPRSAPPS